MICCGMAVKRMVNVRIECEEDKALNVKVDTLTLTGTAKQNLTCFMY